MAKSEDALIAWLSARGGARGSDVLVGIGDDMAVLPVAGGGTVLIGTDMLMDGVHFDTSAHSPEAIGRKALAVNLSDCAAMAVRPWCAVLSVALPASWSMNQAQELLMGMEPLAGQYGCALVGGDTNSWSRPLVVNVTILGKPWEDASPVRRDGMRPGDAVCVTGRLGGSRSAVGGAGAAGGLPWHMRFEPRVKEAHWLSARLGPALRAMMDLSDGLSTDAPRLASASGCGIAFDADALEAVISETARAASKADGRSPMAHALDDGEDFELLFAVAPDAVAELAQGHTGMATGDAVPPKTWTPIGTAVAEAGIWMRHPDGRREAIKPGGWRHFVD